MLARRLEFLGERRVALRRVLYRPTRGGVLHPPRALALLVRHGAARLLGRGKFGVGEVERHVAHRRAAG
jgi:hypothetical protein